MNKKGIAFIIVAIVFLAVMSIIHFSGASYNLKDKQSAIEIRMVTMNDFLKDFYGDAERAAYISGYRTFIAMEEHISQDSHAFLTDPEATFIECFMNGTIDGNSIDIMENSSFSSYQDRVNAISNTFDVDFSANLTHVAMEHNDPWNVNVTMDFDIFVQDRKGLAKWETQKRIITQIPIIDLKDPLYSVKSGLVVTVKPFSGDFFVNDSSDQNDTSGLYAMFNESYYMASARAPSFVMRFSGNLSNSTYGIESFVNTEDLSKPGFTTYYYENNSIIDYIYFNGSIDTAKYCTFQNLPGFFKLDNETVNSGMYGIFGNISYGLC
ncbi:hypothetical protein C4573_02050 [Candidatus Woesearchaeota archaeon]|nr:MAG: hypothetical protein C4573_02050 [Candidatus Woesearchaeota archaeon]